MIRLLVPLLLAGLLYLAWRASRRSPSPGTRRAGMGLLALALAALIGLALAGRIPWPVAVAAPAAVMLRWVGRLAFAWPMIARLFAARRHRGQTRPPGPEPSGSSSDQRQRSRGAGAGRRGTSMTREQAHAILGLSEGATREEIVAAHRRLVQKVHPDTGGSDYLASQINGARDLLLDR